MYLGLLWGIRGVGTENGLAMKRKDKDKMDDLTIYHRHQQQQQGLNN
jgi:hypothetical protein